MTTRNVLEVKNLSVAYGKVEAVSGVSLAVGEGKIVTVIGPLRPGRPFRDGPFSHRWAGLQGMAAHLAAHESRRVGGCGSSPS